MSHIDPHRRVTILPFTRQVEGEEAVIGLPDRSLFVSLPSDALDILDALAQGRTIAECQASYRAKYGEIPDVEDLLATLAARGFVAMEDGSEPLDKSAPVVPAVAAGQARYHFAWFPESWAKALFGRPALCAASGLIGLAVGVLAADPSLLPDWRALFFERHVTVMLLLLMATGLAATFLHEMAHLIAARAQGVLCRMSIGNRLWVLVAETDMTGVWALPRHQRLLPILAGPLFDGVAASLLVLVLAAERQGWFHLAPLARQLTAALFLGCLLRLVWQCFFFVRTDFYYAYATAFNCKNLMGDTQGFLRNRLARLLRRDPPIDQRHIPSREMRAIRAYSLFWLIGRGVAFTTLFLVTVPLLWSYTIHIGSSLFSGRQGDEYLFFDSLAIALIQLGVTAAGFILWLRSIYQTWRRT